MVVVMDKEITSLRVTQGLKKELSKIRIHPRETYAQIIERLLECNSKKQ